MKKIDLSNGPPINLSEAISCKLDSLSEYAMDSHIVDFAMKDGSILERIRVAGGRFAWLPDHIDPSDIVDIIKNHLRG